MKIKFVEPKEGIGLFIFDCCLVAGLCGCVVILTFLIEKYG
jgi:hypothetical protein